MNVLITSAGRRTTLLKHFQAACRAHGGKVLAGDMDPLAPALYLADRGFVLPAIGHGSYLDRLIDIVRREKIRLLVPTIDPELPFLAEHAEAIAEAGGLALISTRELTGITGDKWLTTTRLAEAGIEVPRSWLPDSMEPDTLPRDLFIKPRDGSASQHAYAIERDGLAVMLERVPNAIVQERLDGPEITIDALLDLDGRPLHYVPRRRVRTLAGESIQGVTIDDGNGLGDWLVRVLRAVAGFGGRGPMTLQAFLTARGPVLTEINPRFGGGFPLGHAAGGLYPEWLLRMVDGEHLEPRLGEYERGLYMTRFNTEHFTNRPIGAED